MSAENLSVHPIGREETLDYILNIHYAHRIPSISYAYGLFDSSDGNDILSLMGWGALIGIITFGTPASSTLLRGVCGDDYKHNVIELNRLCLKYNRHNEASFLISHALKLLPKPTIVVSFADTSQQHLGIVYQSTNFIYTGLSVKFLDAAVKGLEHQHHATYAHGKSNKQLRDEYGDRLYYRERARKHRYIYFCGSKSQKRNMLKALRYPILPYPKNEGDIK